MQTSDPSCRRRLQARFDQECCYNNLSEDKNKSFPSTTTNNNGDNSFLSTILSFNNNDNTKKLFRNSVERVTKSFCELRKNVATFSQKFRVSTRRRKILEEGPVTPGIDTPYRILGRTPTKLYSPFGIETPKVPQKGGHETIMK